MIDEADYAFSSASTWCEDKNGYVVGKRNGKKISLHRLLMNPGPGLCVDHIDGNKRNNQRSNLRIATRRQNALNRRPKLNGCADSNYKGVAFQDGKWRARIGVDGEQLSLGYFKSENAAARAYDHAAVLYFGEYAQLNFPVLKAAA